MRHVEAIAREPHPLGSAAGEAVRAYLVEELKKLGLEPELQRPRDTRGRRDDPKAIPDRADVVNVVARWRGTGPPGKKRSCSRPPRLGPAWPAAPAHASGVAAILEALRASRPARSRSAT